MVQLQDGRVITIMEKKYFVSKSKFTQIATYRESTVQSEDRKKKHTVKNQFQSGKQ